MRGTSTWSRLTTPHWAANDVTMVLKVVVSSRGHTRSHILQKSSSVKDQAPSQDVLSKMTCTFVFERLVADERSIYF